MTAKVMGYREFNSKKTGRLCKMLAVATPYNASEVQSGCVGFRVEDIFLPDDCGLKVSDSDIGKEVVIDYNVVGGRAYVNGVVLKK